MSFQIDGTSFPFIQCDKSDFQNSTVENSRRRKKCERNLRLSGGESETRTRSAFAAKYAYKYIVASRMKRIVIVTVTFGRDIVFTFHELSLRSSVMRIFISGSSWQWLGYAMEQHEWFPFSLSSHSSSRSLFSFGAELAQDAL